MSSGRRRSSLPAVADETCTTRCGPLCSSSRGEEEEEEEEEFIQNLTRARGARHKAQALPSLNHERLSASAPLYSKLDLQLIID
jgi:hypothetical protein